MGSQSFKAGVEDAFQRCEARLGKLTVSGRYHRTPRCLHDDYEVDETVLGTGKSGKVILARNRQTGLKHALKTLSIKDASKSQKEEFKNEAEVFIAMDHPHIARLADVYESEDQLDLVMEYMDGGELFDRTVERGYFAEEDAASATWQMLLALNYLHHHGIAHRDIKLENFLYERKGSNHLKLIDFGLSKFWGSSAEMTVRCGTLSYCAPEVIKQSYTSQCDLWSLGVVVFILLGGYMPFSGTADQQVDFIKCGRYVMTDEAWDDISDEAKDFVRQLLVVDPAQRLTAEQALAHPWVQGRQQRHLSPVVDRQIVDALRCYARASRFRRVCMSVMAWSLSNEELATAREAFLHLDRSQRGAIKLQDLRDVLRANFNVDEEEIKQVLLAFQTSNTNTDEIQYSEFVAALAASQIALHEHLFHATFRRFDTHSTGYITADSLQRLLGESVDEAGVADFIAEADMDRDGKISSSEFISYICVGSAKQARKHAEIRLAGTKRQRLDSNFENSCNDAGGKKTRLYFGEMSEAVNLGPTYFARD